MIVQAYSESLLLLHILRPFVRLALWVFLRKIDIRGRDRIPEGRPLIFVANHPNVMLDTLILGLYAPGKMPRFLGKSTLFKRSLYAWFMLQLGVIAVARRRDETSRMSSNRAMLSAACQTLRDGGSLALFPEGISHAETRVLELKPGAARIALRCEAEGRAGVCIIPVGLTYSDPRLFRSDVSIHFGEAIEVRSFLDAEQELTTRAHESLVALTRHIDDPDLETVIRDLSVIYTENVAAELQDSADLSKRLRAEQEIIRAVHHFADTDAELVQTFATRVRAHHRKLRRLRLDADTSPASSPHVGHLLLALVFSPLTLYGFVHNALPYYLPRLFVRPHRNQPEMIGTVKIVAGFVVFPLYYLVLIGTAYLLTDLRTAFLYGFTLPVSGLVTLLFDEHILQKWPLWRGLVLPRRRRYYLKRMSQEREAIIRDLDTIKESYLALQS